MLTNVVYVSAATRHLEPAELVGIIDVSRRNNARQGINGLLLHHEGNFMQALEGPETQILALVESMKRDPRHDGMIVMVQQAIEKRYFPDWAMGCRNADGLPPNERGTVRRRFDEIRGSATGSSLAMTLLLGFRNSMTIS